MPSKADIVKRRQSQRDEIRNSIEVLEFNSKTLNTNNDTLVLLESVSEGLYLEIDKLTKKSPADQVTNLLLTQVNDCIREAKALATSDPFMQRYTEFVAAGDNPEHRDVILIIRQIRQGLNRFKEHLTAKRKKTQELLSDAKGIDVALELNLQGQTSVDKDSLKYNKAKLGSQWFTDGFNPSFDFDELDSIDISEHFEVK